VSSLARSWRAKEVTMHAEAGDTLRTRGHQGETPERCGEILEARGPDGTVPFVVRWDDTGHTTLFFPWSDAIVEHHRTGGASHEHDVSPPPPSTTTGGVRH
jgi:Domain of unknown function (DUF1918)